MLAVRAATIRRRRRWFAGATASLAAAWLAFACFGLCAFGVHAHHHTSSPGARKAGAPAPPALPAPGGRAALVPVPIAGGAVAHMSVIPCDCAADPHRDHAPSADQDRHAGHGTPSPVDEAACEHERAAGSPLPGMPLLAALALAACLLPLPGFAARCLLACRARLPDGFFLIPEPVPRAA